MWSTRRCDSVVCFLSSGSGEAPALLAEIAVALGVPSFAVGSLTAAFQQGGAAAAAAASGRQRLGGGSDFGSDIRKASLQAARTQLLPIARAITPPPVVSTLEGLLSLQFGDADQAAAFARRRLGVPVPLTHALVAGVSGNRDGALASLFELLHKRHPLDLNHHTGHSISSAGSTGGEGGAGANMLSALALITGGAGIDVKGLVRESSLGHGAATRGRSTKPSPIAVANALQTLMIHGDRAAAIVVCESLGVGGRHARAIGEIAELASAATRFSDDNDDGAEAMPMSDSLPNDGDADKISAPPISSPPNSGPSQPRSPKKLWKRTPLSVAAMGHGRRGKTSENDVALGSLLQLDEVIINESDNIKFELLCLQ